MSKSRENALSYSPHEQTKENKICRDFSIYKYHILKVGNVMWIFNKTMAVRRTFESVLSFYDQDYYYCCFKAAAAAAARMYAIFTISWLLSWISYCVQPKSRQWEFFNKLHTKIFMYILCIILHIYFTFFPLKIRNNNRETHQMKLQKILP